MKEQEGQRMIGLHQIIPEEEVTKTDEVVVGPKRPTQTFLIIVYPF